MNKETHKVLFILSSVIAILILFISAYGLSATGMYAGESLSWQLQCRGQDLVDLAVIVPALAASALLVLNGRLAGLLSWPGIMIYLIYTFVIYCFDVGFNIFFLEYCMILGLCFYGLLYFLYKRLGDVEIRPFRKTGLTTVIAVLFIATGAVFYVLWLVDIIPAIRAGDVPPSVRSVGLATNPVHVIDLSVILPLFIITAVLLLRNKRLGHILAPCLLVFSALMDITILVLNVMTSGGKAFSLVFILLSLLTSVLFILYLRQYSKTSSKKTSYESS